MTRTRLAMAAAVIGVFAALAAGYAAGGQAGLTDAAAVAAVGVLIVARGTLRGGKPGPVRPGQAEPAPAVSAEDFPAFRSIASDLEWGRLSWRHYQHAVRPLLTRLAAALGRRVPATCRRGPRTSTAPARTWPHWTA